MPDGTADVVHIPGMRDAGYFSTSGTNLAYADGVQIALAVQGADGQYQRTSPWVPAPFRATP